MTKWIAMLSRDKEWMSWSNPRSDIYQLCSVGQLISILWALIYSTVRWGLSPVDGCTSAWNMYMLIKLYILFPSLFVQLEVLELGVRGTNISKKGSTRIEVKVPRFHHDSWLYVTIELFFCYSSHSICDKMSRL